jgi:hypothetical protein
MQLPDAIHVQITNLSVGNVERAADELARAYMGGGKEMFSEDHPKYFAFLKTVLKPPAGGEW